MAEPTLRDLFNAFERSARIRAEEVQEHFAIAFADQWATSCKHGMSMQARRTYRRRMRRRTKQAREVKRAAAELGLELHGTAPIPRDESPAEAMDRINREMLAATDPAEGAPLPREETTTTSRPSDELDIEGTAG